jgi:hypothetical protein
MSTQAPSYAPIQENSSNARYNNTYAENH